MRRTYRVNLPPQDMTPPKRGMRKSTYFRLVNDITEFFKAIGGTYYRTYSDKLTDPRRYRTKIARVQSVSNETMAKSLHDRFSMRGVTITLQAEGQAFYSYPSIVIRPNLPLRAG